MLDGFDLNLLRAFDVLVDAEGVTAAAERLHLSIPATSRVLARLRLALGDPVLVRSGRGMTVTPLARRIAPRVREILQDVAALVEADREIDPALLQRTFTLRMNDGIAATALPALVHAASSVAPGVVLRVAQEGDESAQDLRNGSVDLDIGVQNDAPTDLCSAPLYTDRLVAIVRSGSAIGYDGELTAAELCSRPHIGTSRRGLTHGPVDDALAALGEHRTIAAVVPTAALTALLVATTDTIGLVPHRLAEYWSSELDLRWSPIAIALPPLQIAMQWHLRSDADRAHRWLRDLVRTALTTQTPRPA